MGETKEQSSKDSEKQTEDEEGRVSKATEVYCETCDESGVKVSAWEDFPAWGEFVEGNIDEPQFAEKAKTEMEQFAETFGKYVVLEKEDHGQSREEQEEEEKKKRAKRANKTYRKICSEAGITVCFFHDFTSWSQYVEGKISEEEFSNRVQQEIQEIASKSN